MIRNSCRWLTLSAALGLAASGLPGCSSKPLLSGLHLPGTRSKTDSEEKVASTKKPSKATASDAELLAQAKEFEKDGDFPSAARTYRQYFEQQGTTPSGSRPKLSSEADQPAIAAKTRKPTSTPTPVRQASKEVEKPRTPTASDTRVSAKPTIPKEAVATGDASAERPSWADDDKPIIRPKIADKQPRPEITNEDLDDLLDLDEGELDWGEEPGQESEETIAAATPDETNVASVEQLPLINLFNTDPTEPSSSSGMEPPEADAAWSIHKEVPDESPPDVVSQEDSPSSEDLAEEDFAPPVFDDGSDSGEPAPDSMSVLCKSCEPWIYSWAVKLESLDPEVRKDALHHLANSGSSARTASEAVRSILTDTDPLVQCHAAWALWEIENEQTESIETLNVLLNHRKSEVVQLACYMLGDIGPRAEAAADGLLVLRDHAESQTQIHAAEALIRIRGTDEKSVQLLRDSLKSRNAEERWLAAVALGRCRGAQSNLAVEALTKSLSDVEVDVRCAAALSLGGLGADAKPAIPALEQVAHRDDSVVRDAAIAALACIRR